MSEFIHHSKTPSTGFTKPGESLPESGSLLEPVQIRLEDRIVVQQAPSLDDRRPPHVVTNHTVRGREFLTANKRPVTEDAREDAGADVELSAHGVDQGVVALFIGRVGELHVERLQDLVPSAGGVADETESGRKERKD